MNNLHNKTFKFHFYTHRCGSQQDYVFWPSLHHCVSSVIVEDIARKLTTLALIVPLITFLLSSSIKVLVILIKHMFSQLLNTMTLIGSFRRLLLPEATVGSFCGCGLVSWRFLPRQFLQFHFALSHHGPGAVTSNRISLRFAKETERVRGRGRRPSSGWFHFPGRKRNSQVRERHFKEETISSMRSNGGMLGSSCGRLPRFHSGFYLFRKFHLRKPSNSIS
jgi:hypothetical protein